MGLLVTAFGRFEEGPNCSEIFLDRLAEERAGVEALWGGPVAFLKLAVNTRSAGPKLARAVAAVRPTHVLLMGQAAGRPHLSFERVARNRRDFAVPDDRGRIGPLGPVRRGGPESRRATWPDLEAAAETLSAAGVAAETSDDAGSHLCNQTLYLALELAERGDPSFVTTFLHLPLLPEQVSDNAPAAARRPGAPTMPLDDMARAVRLFLMHTRRAA